MLTDLRSLFSPPSFSRVHTGHRHLTSDLGPLASDLPVRRSVLAAFPQLSMPATILFFDHTAQLGGGEIALINAVCTIDRGRFIPVVVLGADGILGERLLEAGIETHLLPIGRSVAQTRKEALGIRSLLRVSDVIQTLCYCVKLAGFIRRRCPSLVHTNSLKSDLIGGVAARLAGVPVIWHVRDRIADDYLPPMVARFFRFLCRVIPNAVIANSQATLDSLLLPAAKPVNTEIRSAGVCSRASVIHDGVKLDHTSHLSRPKAASSPRIGLVGRLAPWKGQHIFIRAAEIVARKHPDCQFHIVGAALFGEEAYERELRSLVESLGLERQIEFTGFRTDVTDLMRLFDIVVHASTTGEPFGQVVIEAMAASKPVVATNGGGIPEIVEDGVTGTLVPMGDVPAMASAILGLIENPESAKQMGMAGRERVEKFFTIEKTVRKMEDVFAGLIDGRFS